MKGVKVKFSISRNIWKKLRDAVTKSKRDKKFLKFAGDIVLKRVKDNLKKEGYSEGKRFVKWKPLKPSTIKEKKRGGYSTKILERTKKMKNSLDYKISNDSVKVVSTKYMIYHQYGTEKMPKRKLVTLSADDIEKIKKKFASVLKSKAKLKKMPRFEFKPKIKGDFDDAK